MGKANFFLGICCAVVIVSLTPAVAVAEFKAGDRISVSLKPGISKESSADNPGTYIVMKCSSAPSGLCMQVNGQSVNITANGAEPTISFFSNELKKSVKAHFKKGGNYEALRKGRFVWKKIN